MKSIYTRRGACSLIAISLSACGTATKVDQVGAVYPSKPENCEVAIFEKPARPNANVEVLAKIESHIKRNFFLGGKVSVKEDAYKELRLRACQLGGDSLIIEDSVESAAAEMTHVHVWATVLRTSR